MFWVIVTSCLRLLSLFSKRLLFFCHLLKLSFCCIFIQALINTILFPHYVIRFPTFDYLFCCFRWNQFWFKSQLCQITCFFFNRWRNFILNTPMFFVFIHPVHFVTFLLFWLLHLFHWCFDFHWRLLKRLLVDGILVGLSLNLFVYLLCNEVVNRLGDADKIPHTLQLMMVIMRTDGSVYFFIDGGLDLNFDEAWFIRTRSLRLLTAQEIEIYLH